MGILTFARLGLQPSQSGFAYVLGGNLYLSLTNNLPMCETSLLKSRGPGFSMPADSGFYPLPDSSAEPSAQDLAEIIKGAYDEVSNSLGSMGEKDAGIVFAGMGEPLTKLDVLLETVELVAKQRNGLSFRINTNGMFGSETAVAGALAASSLVVTDDTDRRRETRISNVSVALMCDNPKTYDTIMLPKKKGKLI